MRRDSWIQVAAGGVLVVSMVSSGALATAISATAGRAQLTYTDHANSGDPPEIAVGIALGAFRGLFVNILWMRAQKMKQEGKFHESIELARTITRLQPRFPQVWAFQAWNMAYNISVASPTAEERWEWVQAGIKLLRDEGIPKNPNDMLLHKELAWIFVHKIQGVSDDANLFYKRRLAREWQILLGPPPPRAKTVEETKERFEKVLERIVKAPSTEADLIEQAPRASELINRLKNEAHLELNFSLLRAAELRRAMYFAYAPEGVSLELKAAEKNEAFEKILQDISADQELANAWSLLMAHVRRRQLIDVYHMEPARMLRYTQKYGPLDWRHPASHGLYWTTRGVEEAMQRRNTKDFDLTNTDRVITQAIQELFRWGSIEYDILNDSYVQMLDMTWVDVYGRILSEDLDKRATSFEDPSRVFRLFSLGYQNFLRDVIRVYYRMGEYDKAEEYYTKLRTYKYINMNSVEFDINELSMPLKDFVEVDVEERITSPAFAQSEIVGTLQDAYRRGLLRGDLKVFQHDMEYAAKVHDLYMRKQNMRTTPDKASNRMEQFSARFYEVAADVLVSTFSSGQIGPRQQALMYRRLLGSKLRPVAQAAYERLLAVAKPRLKNFDVYFPEPPGMAAYRARVARMKAGSQESLKDQVKIERK